MHKVGLIRVLTTDEQPLLQLHGRLIEEAFPHLQVRSRCIPDQPQGIYDAATEAMAVPKIVHLAKEMAAAGAEALIVSCAADPGVPEVRRELSLPVIGAGSAAAALALALGRRVGTLGINAEAPEPMKRVLGTHLVAQSKPAAVRTTLDLLTENGTTGVFAAARELKERGCDVICLACTGLSTLQIADELGRATGLPVVDPVIAAGVVADYLLRRGTQVI